MLLREVLLVYLGVLEDQFTHSDMADLSEYLGFCSVCRGAGAIPVAQGKRGLFLVRERRNMVKAEGLCL